MLFFDEISDSKTKKPKNQKTKKPKNQKTKKPKNQKTKKPVKPPEHVNVADICAKALAGSNLVTEPGAFTLLNVGGISLTLCRKRA